MKVYFADGNYLYGDLSGQIGLRRKGVKFGQALTGSAYRRAKDQLRPGPAGEVSPKQKYVVALFSLYPGLTISAVRGKTQLFLKEDTRADVVQEWQEIARVRPVSDDLAREVIAQVEARPTSVPTFGLEGSQ